MSDDAVFTPRTVLMLVGIALCAAGVAAAIAILNVAGRAIMGLGGFVAYGGPYEIAVPAPGWAPMVPLAILTGFAFGGWSIHIASRAGGCNLIVPTWVVLFVSLGIQFATMALNPPGGGGIAWGWMICAIVFVPMGLAGILVYRDMRGAMRGPDWGWGERYYRPCENARYRTAYLVFAILGAAAGLWGGLALFASLAA